MPQEKHPQPTSNADKRQPTPAMRLAQAGLAFGLAYILGSWAIDTGSLLQYAIALLFLGLGARHVVQLVKVIKAGRG